jgi:thiamine biosynthesis lipoprotein
MALDIKKPLSKRRFLQIVGVSCIGTHPLLAFSKNKSIKLKKNGRLLGTDAQITIFCDSKEKGELILDKCFGEVKKLELIFSLYKDNSVISRLNKYGEIHGYPKQFRRLVEIALKFSKISNGAFDITVQPLWKLYESHYSNKNNANTVIEDSEIKNILKKVDYKKVFIENKKIFFKDEDMAMTLNGIAQGYITDKVIEILANFGISNTLVNMGEYRALGSKNNGEDWKIGIRNPDQTWKISQILPMQNMSAATSGGYGHFFDRNIKAHHIFNPKSGKNDNFYKSVTVKAKTATIADGLSTTLFATNKKYHKQIINNFKNIEVIYI